MSDTSSADARPASETAVRYLLHTAHRRLDMEAAFLAELTETEQIYRATAGTSGTFTVFDGGRLPRLEGYCQRVMESDSPWVIRDAHQEPAVRELDVTEAGRFGAYIGVPVRLPDGRPFGTLCCVHHTPREDLGDNEVSVLEALADVLGFHVDQLAGREERIDDLETYVDDLADRLGEHELRLEAFRHLADVSLNATLLLRPDSFHIEYANLAAAELVGTDPSALVGTLPWEHHACWSEVTLRPPLEALAGGRSRPVRYQQDPVDGAPAMDIQIQRFSTEGGTDFLLWKGHDVTIHRESTRRLQGALELEREASDRLRTVDAQRNAFRTAVSHELRTPLTIVRGAAETLRSGRVEGDARDTLLDRLDANARRLDRLLANAVIHTPPGTRIDLRLARDPQGAHLIVADDGPGIPSETRSQVFEPFRQGATAPSHRPGAGIGLSLVAAFAEVHDGRAWVEEVAGGGAAFHVLLPLESSDDGPATR